MRVLSMREYENFKKIRKCLGFCSGGAVTPLAEPGSENLIEKSS
jgi:hypothetical protein